MNVEGTSLFVPRMGTILVKVTKLNIVLKPKVESITIRRSKSQKSKSNLKQVRHKQQTHFQNINLQ